MSLCVEPTAIHLFDSSDVFLFPYLMATQVSHRISEVWAISTFKKLVLACRGGLKADLCMPCDGFVLQQSLLSLQLWEEKLHSGGLSRSDPCNLKFPPPLLCDLIQGP